MADLNRLAAILIGMLIGASVGLVLEQLPTRPLVQAASAALLSCVVTSVGASLLWLKRTGHQVGAAAISVGVVDGLLGLGIVLAIGAIAYFVLGRIGYPALEAHRAAILGALGGLLGVLAAPVGEAIANP